MRLLSRKYTITEAMDLGGCAFGLLESSMYHLYRGITQHPHPLLSTRLSRWNQRPAIPSTTSHTQPPPATTLWAAAEGR